MTPPPRARAWPLTSSRPRWRLRRSSKLRSLRFSRETLLNIALTAPACTALAVGENPSLERGQDESLREVPVKSPPGVGRGSAVRTAGGGAAFRWGRIVRQSGDHGVARARVQRELNRAGRERVRSHSTVLNSTVARTALGRAASFPSRAALGPGNRRAHGPRPARPWTGWMNSRSRRPGVAGLRSGLQASASSERATGPPTESLSGLRLRLRLRISDWAIRAAHSVATTESSIGRRGKSTRQDCVGVSREFLKSHTRPPEFHLADRPGLIPATRAWRTVRC